MKGIVASLALAGLLCVSSCTTNNNNTQIILGMTFTLQGVVADAVTGARLGGDLKLYLVQGAEIRGPTRLDSNTGDALAGEYAFVGIPLDFNNGNVTWKVVALKTGYQRFESDLTFNANFGEDNIIDQVYSRIGNIYLFPTGVTAPEYDITAMYLGRPVPTATVQLDPVNQSVVFAQGDALSQSPGLTPSLQAATDASGKAAFAGNLLAVGVSYNVQVLPVAFKDTTGTTVQLGLFNPNTPVTITAGISNTALTVALVDLVAGNPTPLFLVSASNQPSNQPIPTGQLAFVFNAPVSLVNPNGFGAALTAGTNAAGNAPGAGVLAATPVTASLSTDGLTLTLTPNFTTAPAADDRGTSITYSNGTGLVSPKDYPAQSLAIFTALKFSDGTAPSGVVAMRGP
jgi:hypothetical protein